MKVALLLRSLGERLSALTADLAAALAALRAPADHDSLRLVRVRAPRRENGRDGRVWRPHR